MLGSDLVPALSAKHRVDSIDIQEADLAQPASVAALADRKPEMIVHLAAMTNVDGCERDPEQAYRVNGLGTRHAALACQRLGVPMLYISTDFVFDGSKKEPYLECDAPNPLGHYGRSKLAGEAAVRELLRQFYIVRTSWLYGRNGKNFVAAILQKAREAGEVKVVDDQIGSPTYTRDLAEAIALLIDSNISGTYHLSNSGSCSWFEFATEAVRLAGIKATVRPIKSSEYPTPTRRPAYSVLDNFCWRQSFGQPLRDWKEGLRDFIKEAYAG